MLNWTGHPLVDVGIATILALVHKTEPEALTEDDLAQVADFIEREYVRQPLKSFLTVAFPNSGFTQPAFESQPERRLAYAQNVTRQFGAEVETTYELCVFTQEPTPNVVYNDKPDDSLPPGRAFRHHVPMTLGVGAINFYPGGDPGLPVSAAAMLALQAFPLGCAKVGGRLLAVHADDPIPDALLRRAILKG